MGWKPGESGNPAGSGQKPFLSALKRAIAQDDSKRLRESAEQLLTLAAQGEPWAVNMLADRLDGKVSQPIAGDPESPLVVEILKFAGVTTTDSVSGAQNAEKRGV